MVLIWKRIGYIIRDNKEMSTGFIDSVLIGFLMIPSR